MKISEGEQLEAFCNFVETNNLDDELRRKDWTNFARGYNGKNYFINKYDAKMANFYDKFKQEKVDCQALLNTELTPANISSRIDELQQKHQPDFPAGLPTDEGGANPVNNAPPSPPQNPTTGAGAVQAQTVENQQPQTEGNQTAEQITNINADTDAAKVEAAQSMPPAEIEKTKKVGFMAKVSAFFAAIFTGQYLVPQPVTDAAVSNSGTILNFIGAILKAAYDSRYLIITVIVIWYVVKKVNNAWLTNKIATTNADPTKRDIVLVDAPKSKGLVTRIREYFFGVKD